MVCSGGPTESTGDQFGQSELSGMSLPAGGVVRLDEAMIERLANGLSTVRQYLISPSHDIEFFRLVNHDLHAMVNHPALQAPVAVLNQSRRDLLFNCARLMSLVGTRFEHEGYHSEALESFKFTLALDERLFGIDPAVSEYYGFDLVNVGRALFALKDFAGATHLLEAGLERYREVRPRDREFVSFIVQSTFICATEWSSRLPKNEALAAFDVPRALCKAFPNAGRMYLDAIEVMTTQLAAK